jgi:hypothetical protein
VTLDFSRLGKPTDNAYIESFSGRVCQECLNRHWFLSLADAQEQVDQWRLDYIENPPAQLLGKSDPSGVREKIIPGAPGMILPWLSNILTGTELGTRSDNKLYRTGSHTGLIGRSMMIKIS